MSRLETNIRDAEYESSILMEAFTFIKHMVPLKKKGAYALGDMVSVYMDIQENDCAGFSLHITCFTFGSRVVLWDRMAVLIARITEMELCPLQCRFFNENGHLVFPSLPGDAYVVTPFNKFKEEIRIAPATSQDFSSDPGFTTDFSLAAKGRIPGKPELHEFTSLDGCIHGAFMISGCETEIIMYTNDRGFKDRYIYFAFINSVTKDIVKYGEIQLCEQEEDLSCLKGLWKGRIAARESVAFIFSDPMK